MLIPGGNIGGKGKNARNQHFLLFLQCFPKVSFPGPLKVTGRLAQMVERRTREHNVSGLYRCGFESPAGQLKLNRGPV